MQSILGLMALVECAKLKLECTILFLRYGKMMRQKINSKTQHDQDITTVQSRNVDDKGTQSFTKIYV